MKSSHQLLVNAVCAACALALSEPTFAAPITVFVPVGFSCGTGNNGFEPGCTPEVERGTLAFTYDDSVLDQDSAADRGVFEGAVIHFRMHIEQETRPDLEFRLSGPGDLIFLRDPVNGPQLRISVPTIDISGSYGLGRIGLQVFRTSYGGSLDSAPAIGFWQAAVANQAYAYNAFELDWGLGFSASQGTLIPTPNTTALVLLGLGLLAIGSRRQLGQVRAASAPTAT